MESDRSEHISSYGSRKRATKACLACRTRKVRCDAVHRDGKCTNCTIDNKQCIVKARPTKYRSKKFETNQLDSSNQPSDQPQEHHFVTDIEPANHSSLSLRLGTPSDSTWINPFSGGRGSSTSSIDTPHDHVMFNTSVSTRSQGSQERSSGPASRYSDAIKPAHTEPDHKCTQSSHVIYSYFPFLQANLSLLPEQDVQFLESQGCLRVPSRHLADEFMQEYFLHVHPGLPMLDESRFWAMYVHTGVSEESVSFLSLFVFQAMLFASCSYVSFDIIQKLGFASIRKARDEYYRRAKLLFDFCAERDLVSSAQGSLLLSYNATMRDRKRVNSIWLSTAIQMARGAGADNFHIKPNQPPHQQNTLKRLWWCCIVRDRILPLGVRRQLSISLEHFDLDGMALTEADFDEDITGSQVYDAETKAALMRLFIALCDLSVSLTDVILTVYPTSGAILKRSWSLSNINEMLDRVQSCKLALKSWTNRATAQFPDPEVTVRRNESIILFSNLIYIDYHSARLALYEHESLILIVRSFSLGYEEPRWPEIKLQLADATAGITDNLKELIHLKLGKYIPISIVAYAAIPLVLHILDVKLSTSASQVAHKQRQLKVYMDAMESFRAQYDGTDEVWSFIRSIVDYATARRPQQRISASSHKTSSWRPMRQTSSTIHPSTTIHDWGCIFLYQPSLFFQITHTVNISLSNNQYSEECGFPLALRSPQVALSCISLGNVYDCHGTHKGDKEFDRHHTDEASFNVNTKFATQGSQMDMPNELETGLSLTNTLHAPLCDIAYRPQDVELSSFIYDDGLLFDENEKGTSASLLPSSCLEFTDVMNPGSLHTG